MVGLVVHMHGGLVLTKKSTVGAAIITTLCLLIRVHHSDNLLGDSVAAAEADFNFLGRSVCGFSYHLLQVVLHLEVVSLCFYNLPYPS